LGAGSVTIYSANTGPGPPLITRLMQNHQLQ